MLERVEMAIQNLPLKGFRKALVCVVQNIFRPRVAHSVFSRVEKGVEALLAIVNKNPKGVTLVEYPDRIDLQFTLNRILYKERKVLALDLPHSIHHKAREVCVFVKDLDQKNREYEDTIEHYEELFKANKVTEIAKIVPIKALKTDYSQPGAKKSLARAYDLFLSDKCVFGTLPALLGKTFFSKKSTVPVQVELDAKNLQKEVARAVGNTRCEMNPHGNCHIMTVAHSWMDKTDIIDNVLAAASQIAKKLHGGQKIIRNISIKGERSTAVPLYVNLSDPGHVSAVKRRSNKVEVFTDDITTVEAGPVRITADGFVEVLGDNKPVITGNRKPRTGQQRKRGRDGRDRSKSAGGKKTRMDRKLVEVKEEADVGQRVGDKEIKIKEEVKVENKTGKKTDAKRGLGVKKPLNRNKGSKMMRFRKGLKKPK